MKPNDPPTVESWLVAELSAPLADADFYWYAPLHQFRRKTATGFVCIILSVTDFVDSCLVEAHLGVRHAAVEERVFGYLNGAPGFRPDSMTLVTPLGRLFGKRSERFPVADRAAAERVARQLHRRLFGAGLPLLQRYTRLAELEELYNAAPEHSVPLLHNPVHRCFRGLVLAHLRDTRDLPALYTRYAAQLKGPYAADWALVNFARLGQDLLGYSLN